MLNVFLGDMPDAVFNTAVFFKNDYEDEWIIDPFVVDMIREHVNNGSDSSIQLVCDKPCFVLEGATWRGQLSEMQSSIVFIDEGNAFIFTNEFAEVIQKTDNYFVIVSREGILASIFQDEN